MDQNHLLLLGLLKAQESHGYQLLDFVERKLSRITPLKKATAYYELKRMEQQGLISVRKEQEGGRPPRQVFSLTAAGEDAFVSLLKESLRSAESPEGGAEVGLMFLNSLSPEEARPLLQERLEGLRSARQRYQSTLPHLHGPSVNLAISHVSSRLQMEITWFESLLAKLEESLSPTPALPKR